MSVDDFSPVPIAPALAVEPEQVDPEYLVEDKRVADAFYHPAWDKVLKQFNEELEALHQPTDPNLIAEEYKIADLSKKQAIVIIERVVGRVKDAVQAVESVESDKRNKSSQGGK
jgi:hypothetical protein